MASDVVNGCKRVGTIKTAHPIPSRISTLMDSGTNLRQDAIARLPQDPAFPCPANEVKRLAKLLEYDILDSLPEQRYDDLTEIAAHICGAPIALVSLLDGDHQWFKSRYGIDTTEAPREHSFCTYAILEPETTFIVADSSTDERFHKNPFVAQEPHIRFYAGASLVTSSGLPLGTLCVLDTVPRHLTDQQDKALQALSRQVVAQLELHRQSVQLQQEKNDLQQTLEQLKMTQASLLQAEKMAAISELTVDIANKISDPLTFIHGNLQCCNDYAQELLKVVAHCEGTYAASETAAVADVMSDLDYVMTDMPKLLASMKHGSERVQGIIKSLQTFSHYNESGKKLIDLHENIDAVCELLCSQFEGDLAQNKIKLEKHYGDVNRVYCIPGLLNQALMYLFQHAIRALQKGVGSQHLPNTVPRIVVTTSHATEHSVQIMISDNSEGLTVQENCHIFEPSYSSQGVSMALSISHQIITQQQGGVLECQSMMGLGIQMIVQLPMRPGETLTVEQPEEVSMP
ncbi:MAG: GAF domain-containing sensor histidine kinase [Cyanobacteria bacterium J06639_14]